MHRFQCVLCDGTTMVEELTEGLYVVECQSCRISEIWGGNILNPEMEHFELLAAKELSSVGEAMCEVGSITGVQHMIEDCASSGDPVHLADALQSHLIGFGSSTLDDSGPRLEYLADTSIFLN